MFGATGGALTGSFDGLQVAAQRLQPDPRTKVVAKASGPVKAAYHSRVFVPMRAGFVEQLGSLQGEGGQATPWCACAPACR